MKPLLASLPNGRAPHMIIGSDICYSQGKQEMQMLADTVSAMCEPGRTVVYVVFEDRGDCCWGTLNHFWTAAEGAGLFGDPTPIEDIEIGGKREERAWKAQRQREAAPEAHQARSLVASHFFIDYVV